VRPGECQKAFYFSYPRFAALAPANADKPGEAAA
jgi:hypothetical protein